MIYVLIGSMLVGVITQSFLWGIVSFVMFFAIWKKRSQTGDSDITQQTETVKDSQQAAEDRKDDYDEEYLEAKKVREKARQKKQEAKEKGLDDLVVDFYEETKHFPSWVENGSSSIPECIEGAEYIEEEGVEKSYEINISGEKYKVKLEEENRLINSTHHLEITVFNKERKIFQVKCSVEIGKWTTTYRPFGVYAYISGQWEKDFQKVLDDIKSLKEEREKERFKDKDTINELRGNFGIE